VVKCRDVNEQLEHNTVGDHNFEKRSQLFCAHNERFPSGWRFVANKTVQQTARDQVLYGDLTWRGVHFLSTVSSKNRLSAPVSAHGLLLNNFTQNPRLCQCKKHYPSLNDVQDAVS
jgi:hypothetical protein